MTGRACFRYCCVRYNRLRCQNGTSLFVPVFPLHPGKPRQASCDQPHFREKRACGSRHHHGNAWTGTGLNPLQSEVQPSCFLRYCRLTLSDARKNQFSGILLQKAMAHRNQTKTFGYRFLSLTGCFTSAFRKAPLKTGIEQKWYQTAVSTGMV